MEPAGRTAEELQPSKTGEASKFLKIPTLSHQQSLQDLIGEELSSFGDSSLEMVELLGRRNKTANSDGDTFEALASETQDESSQTPAAATSGSRSSQDQETMSLPKATKFPHMSLWRRLTKRSFSHTRPNTINFEADV